MFFLAACNVNPHYDSLETYFHTKKITNISLQSLPHCHGYGCKFKQEISLSQSEWNKIKKPLKWKSKSAKTERKNLAKSLKKFEEIVGKKAGTDVDVADTFKKLGDFQLDCADESTNNSLYIKILQDHGLLKHHTVETPEIRGISGGAFWLHETAIIKETKTNKKFAVDSWWKDHGNEPYIIPLEEWKNGWKPEKS